MVMLKQGVLHGMNGHSVRERNVNAQHLTLFACKTHLSRLARFFF